MVDCCESVGGGYFLVEHFTPNSFADSLYFSCMYILFSMCRIHLMKMVLAVDVEVVGLVLL